MKEPDYRVERAAMERALWQGLVNIIRRLSGLPIKATMEEARQIDRDKWRD